jgi:hypothetical protein
MHSGSRPIPGEPRFQRAGLEAGFGQRILAEKMRVRGAFKLLIDILKKFKV